MGYTLPDEVLSKTRALIEGGVRIIQLRAKHSTQEEIRRLAQIMQPICREKRAIFVLNDYPELAVEIGADAVHVGQDAGSLEQIRRITGSEMIIGRSTHSPEQALRAREEGADYIGFGPLFPTGTKPGRPAIGLEHIASVQSKLGNLPMFCIGGINAHTLPHVLQAGAKRVVIVSWLLQQKNIAEAALRISQQLNS